MTGNIVLFAGAGQDAAVLAKVPAGEGRSDRYQARGMSAPLLTAGVVPYPCGKQVVLGRDALRALADTVAPGGLLLVIAPQPGNTGIVEDSIVSQDLQDLNRMGFTPVSYEDLDSPGGRGTGPRWMRVLYRRDPGEDAQ
ncbi:hypothetical protein ACSVHC_00760 [Arthrobacter sp. KNU-44]|uniref:hypothetical protein n=1 Tax=Arthrobacter sp. KNU-44 TaxID=3450744 RepID=UPI003F42E090